VTAPVKAVRLPTTPADMFWTPFTIEAAKSEPGKWGMEIDPPFDDGIEPVDTGADGLVKVGS
jgi:hypothetical protein